MCTSTSNSKSASIMTAIYGDVTLFRLQYLDSTLKELLLSCTLIFTHSLETRWSLNQNDLISLIQTVLCVNFKFCKDLVFNN